MKNLFRAAFAVMLLATCTGCDWFASADRRIERAEEFARNADLRGAMIELQNALQSEPNNLRARLMLAELSIRAGDPQAAAKELQQAQAAGAKDAHFAELFAQTRLALAQGKELLADLDANRFALSDSQRSIYRALALLSLNQAPAAVDVLQATLKNNPDLPDARRALAQAHAQLGDSTTALQELDRLLQTHPDDAKAWLLHGTLQSRRGEYRKAVVDLLSAQQHASTLDVPQQYGLSLMLAETHLALDDRKAARAIVESLTKSAPDAPLTSYMAARVAMAERDYPLAVSQSRKVIDQLPQFQPAKLLLGAALFANGNLNQAQAELAEVIAQSPQDIGARKLLAQVNLRLQRPDLALQALGPAQATDNEDLQADALRGQASLQQGDQAGAIEMLEKVATARPADASAQLDLALAYLSQGQSSKALQLIQSTPAVANSERRTALLIAAVAAANGRDAARAQIDEAVREAPENIGVLNVAATYLVQLGDMKAAQKLLEKAVAAKHNDVLSLMRLGQVEMGTGQSETARQTFERAATAQPTYLPAQVMLARLDFMQGDHDRAIKRLEAVRAASTTMVDARLLLANAYLRRGKIGDADSVLNEVQSLPDAGTPVALAVGRLYYEAAQYDRALARFREAAKKDAANPAPLLGAARAQLALGNRAAARESAEQAAKLGGDPIPSIALLTTLDIQDKRLEQAAQRIRDAQKTAANNPTLTMLQGDVDAAAQRAQAASDAYQRSYRLSPSSIAAVRDYQIRSLNRLPNAPQLLQAWVEQHPADATARMLLGVALMESGSYPAAIAQYEVLAKAQRPNSTVLNNLAWLYSQRGDPRALETAKRAYEAAPDRPEIADTYAWVLIGSNRASEAVPLLERAVRGQHVLPEIRYHYAVALARSGHAEQALQALDALLQAHPDFPQSEDARRLVRELRG